MSKQLNLPNLKAAMDRQGVSQADLSKQLTVSRQAVTKWVQGVALPRPDKLLRLALTLDLTFDELVTRVNGDEPVIAYRKKGARKTKDIHVERAREMGRLLRPLVPYLPFDDLIRPRTLKNPNSAYEYVQKAATMVRKDLGLRSRDVLGFEQLIHKFYELQAVLVPVLWGDRQNHGNALHIFLPDSTTTWVYLNLDAKVHDFKFWMAHELGHMLSPDLRDDAAEDFAESFAGALLFPEAQAIEAWDHVVAARKVASRIDRIVDIAARSLISPVTIYYALNHYAKQRGLPVLDLKPGIFIASRELGEAYYTISEHLFDGVRPDAAGYLKLAGSFFESPFFDALKQYVNDEDKGAGYLQAILDVPLLDAKSLLKALR